MAGMASRPDLLSCANCTSWQTRRFRMVIVALAPWLLEHIAHYTDITVGEEAVIALTMSEFMATFVSKWLPNGPLKLQHGPHLYAGILCHKGSHLSDFTFSSGSQLMNSLVEMCRHTFTPEISSAVWSPLCPTLPLLCLQISPRN